MENREKTLDRSVEHFSVNRRCSLADKNYYSLEKSRRVRNILLPLVATLKFRWQNFAIKVEETF